MTDADREKYKRQLLELRARLTRHVAMIEDALRDDVVPPGENPAAPTHIADEAVEGVEENIILAENEEQLLEQVEDALQRIEDGTYGTCENCDQEIPAERLDALPQTPYCVKCATALAG